MHYNLAEKLAIIKAIDKVARADGKIKTGEVKFMRHIMGILKFDHDLIKEAREIGGKQSGKILSEMSDGKKHALSVLLERMAGSDGNVHKREIKSVLKIFSKAGINSGPKND